MTAPENYNYTLPIQVRFRDLDGLGHINNAVFFTYMETARINYIRDVLGWDGSDALQLNLILASASADFRRPLRLNDAPQVHVRVTRLGNSSFDMEYIITTGDDVAAEGKSVVVVFDYQTGKPTPIPQEWRRTVIAHEPALTE